jgi:hypothetical protein
VKRSRNTGFTFRFGILRSTGGRAWGSCVGDSPGDYRTRAAIQVAIHDYQQDPGASQLLSPLANVQRETGCPWYKLLVRFGDEEDIDRILVLVDESVALVETSRRAALEDI